MAASEGRASDRWTGRSGRRYARVAGGVRREGTQVDLIQVEARGGSTEESPLERGAVVGLKRLREVKAESAADFDAELQIMERLTELLPAPPCPRVVDRLDAAEEGGHAVLVEWCGMDLELWWAARHAETDALAQLLDTLAELAHLVAAFHDAAARDPSLTGVHPLLRPQGLLQGGDGRWVVSSFRREEAAVLASKTDDASTQILASPDAYEAPECIFGARVDHPVAADTWSLACTMVALLRMRQLLVAGAPMPGSGTDGHQFRSHRANLVNDLYQRKPRLFAGRPLDGRQFLYPERLPDADRQLVEAALTAMAPVSLEDEAREALCRDVLSLVERALRLDPARRFTHAEELASSLRRLAARARGETVPSEPLPGFLGAPAAPLEDPAEALVASTRIMRSSTDTEAVLAAAEESERAREESSKAMSRSGAPKAVIVSRPRTGVTSAVPMGQAGGADRPDGSEAGEGSASAEADASRPLSRQLLILEGDLASLRRKVRQLEQDLATVSQAASAPPPPPPASAKGWGATLMAFGSLGLAGLALVLALWALVVAMGAEAPVAPVSGSPVVPAAAAQGPAPTPGEAVSAEVDEAASTAGEGEEAPTAEDPQPSGASPAAQPVAAAAGSSSPPPGSAPGGTGRSKAAGADGAPASEAATADAGGAAEVRVTGAVGVLLDANGKEHEVGSVPAGTYTLFIMEGDERQKVERFELAGGAVADFKCGFGTCRRTR